MKAKSGFVLRHVMDEYILMPSGDSLNGFNGCMLLNGVSAFIWEKLQSAVTRDELLSAILDVFDVDENTAASDLDAFLAQLRQENMLEDA